MSRLTSKEKTNANIEQSDHNSERILENKNDKKTKSSLVKHKSIYLMMAPYFILFFSFTVFPVMFAIVMSFANFNVLQAPVLVGLNNYKDLLLNDPLFLQSLQNTLILALIIGPIGYILSFLMAWVLNEFPRGVRVFFTVVLYAPSLAGTATSIFTLLFSSDSTGYLNALLLNWGIISEPILWLQDPQWMLTIIIFVNLWQSFGIGFLSFIAGLQGIDKSLLEAGEIDGVRNRWQELWYIVLPSMRPQLMFGAVMSISGSFAITGSALTGFPSTGYATHTLIDHIQDYGLIRFELGYASAITVVLFFLTVFFNLLIQKFIARVGE